MTPSASEPTSDDSDAPRSRRRRLTAAVAVCLTAWIAACAVLLFTAASEARSGLDAMEDVRQFAQGDIPTFVDSVDAGSDDLSEETTQRSLQLAAESFGRVNGIVDSPVLWPLRITPVIGRQLRSVDALSEAAQLTASSSESAFGELESVLSGSTETASARLAAARTTEAVLNALTAEIGNPYLGPTEGLVGPLANARNRFSTEHAEVMETLDTAAAAVTGVTEFLSGPTRYLVLAANNAEMRAGSGMYLQVGVMEVGEGRFDVGDLAPSGDLYLEVPGAEMDPDIEENWGWLVPNQEWRNLNVTARFDESARMASEMWEATGGKPVDGVIAVDLVGLRDLLELLGPVDVGTTEAPDIVDADSVISNLMLDQYLSFADDNFARRDRLGSVASATFEAFNERPISAGDLLKALYAGGEGRHIMAWSSSREQQDAWVALDAAGELPENSMLLSVINRSGTKLDQFLDVSADVSVSASDAGNRVSIEIFLANEAPDGLPTYVQGPYPGSGLTAGEYLGILALTVPSGAGNLSVAGADEGSFFADGATRTVTAPVRLSRGQELVLTIEFDLTDDWTTIEVQPSARIPPVSWTAGELAWEDGGPQNLPITIESD